MRRKLRERAAQKRKRYIIYGTLCLLTLVCITVNCTMARSGVDTALPETQALAYENRDETMEKQVAPVEQEQDPGFKTALAGIANGAKYAEETAETGAATVPLAEGSGPGFEDLWADVSGTVTGPTPGPAPSTERISLNVHEANLLDVLSMLAYKLEGNATFLFIRHDNSITEEPIPLVTIRTENLSPLTTLEIVLQKEGLDYLVAGRNFIIGDRERLYEDFFNRMMLTRFNLYFISADLVEAGVGDLGIPVEVLNTSSNQRALWMQGTPIALSKAREMINSLDVMENAAFGFGGSRRIRMPVASATGPRALEELEALIDFLSILLDGYRDGRVAYGWATWDHPDPVPSIFMHWDSPVIKPYDIKMKITRDFAGDMDNEIRYLVAEGNPDNINLVMQMIAAIRTTPETPFPFTASPEPELEMEQQAQAEAPEAVEAPHRPAAENRTQPVADRPLSLSLFAVPSEGGSLSGAGTYNRGEVVTVGASPRDGYEFAAWVENGVELSRSPVFSFYIYDTRSIEGVFKLTGEQDHLQEQGAFDIND